MSERIAIATGAAVGSMIERFQGALAGAGVVTTEVATFQFVKGVIVIGRITYKVVRGAASIVTFAVGRHGKSADQGEKMDLDEGSENESGTIFR